MAIPAVIGLILNLLGSKKDSKGESYQMQGVDANKQPTVGDVTGAQPPAMQQQGNGLRNFVGKAQTIGNVIGALGSNQQQPQGGYQMQLNRRR